jgi:hypothetical protein
MPNRYSHSSVLAQYCKSGFISLPDELYLAYIRASSVGSLVTQRQLSTTSRHLSTEDDVENSSKLTRATHIGSPSAPDSGHHDQRGRGRSPAQRPQFTLSHKPSPQDQWYGVLIQEPSRANPLSHRNWSPFGERNGAKLTNPHGSHFASSSTSVAETTTSDAYALDIPSDLPVHADEAAFTPHRARSTISKSISLNTLVARQDAIVNTGLSIPQSADGPESRSRPTSNNVAKFPARSASVPATRQGPSDGANVRDAGATAKPYPPSSFGLTPTQTLAERGRSSSRSRNQSQQKTGEDNLLPRFSGSGTKVGAEVADTAALLSRYESGAKIPADEAVAVERLPSPQSTASIAVQQASSLATIGSNETSRMQPRARNLSRPASTISSETQIYAPLSSASPADSSHVNGDAFIPEFPVVAPGSLTESALEQASSAATQKRRDYSRESSDVLHALPSDHSERLGSSPSEVSSDPGSTGRNNKFTLVYRDRKQEWLQDPAHSVAHFRSPLRRDAAGHRRFASSYTSLTGEPSAVQRLDPPPSTNVAPLFPQAQGPFEFDVMSVSEASTSESSVFYPPDIARYRDENTAGRKSESMLRLAKQWREDTANGNVAGSGSSNSLSRKTAEKKGTGLLRKLRGVSMGGIL